jgi:PAS domain S-box-containing protein
LKRSDFIQRIDRDNPKVHYFMQFENFLKMISPKRFMVQLIVIFVIFTLGTILAIGIPATLIMQRQTNNQMKALLDQSVHTTQTLLENKNNQLDNLAFLLLERPTLNTLLSTGASAESLTAYLDDIRQNSSVDVILICSRELALSVSGFEDGNKLCEVSPHNFFAVSNDLVWLIANATLPTGETIIVGQQLDSTLTEFSTQTDLDYALFSSENWIAGTIDLQDSGLSKDLPTYQAFSLETGSEILDVAAAQIPIPDHPDLQLFGFLNISTFIQTNRQLHNTILIVLFGVSFLSAVIAVLVSKRISKPLNELAVSAARLREGNLNSQLTTVSNLWEIDQLANALEDARVSLKHSLDQLQKEKAWIEELLNAIVEGLLTLDTHQRITFASTSISRITGKDPSEILGQPIDIVFSTTPGEEPFSQQIPDTDQVRRIPTLIHGKEILLAVSRSEFFPPEAGNATTTLVVRDVTDEERIHHLLGEFLANITHEFRTPLTALSASLELLVDKLPDLSNEEIEQLLRALNIGIVNLQALIDNLIEAASIEAGRFKINSKMVEINQILDDAVGTMTPIAKLHKVSIIRSDPNQNFLVLADRRRTAQVLINLLSNAIKHSPDEGKITIRTMLVEKHLLVEVQDQGPGIPEGLQNRVFNRFLSSQPKSEEPQIGLGLGLSVVKAIIEAEHGNVGFRNAESGGAIFWFTLPTASGVD